MTIITINIKNFIKMKTETVNNIKDWVYSPHYKDDAQGHIFSNHADKMICNIQGVAAETQGNLNKNAELIVTAVNACKEINPDNPLNVAKAIPELFENANDIKGLLWEYFDQLPQPLKNKLTDLRNIVSNATN
jgi:hypothetical protein